MFIAWVHRSSVPFFVQFEEKMSEKEQKVCFGENSRWRKIYPGANGRGLYGEMRLDPRNPGKKEFYISDLRFKSYGAKRKVARYGATMRPSHVIIFQLILKIIMNLLSEV